MEKFDSELIEVVRITGEVYSKQVSHAAATMFLADLVGFKKQQIILALAKCRRELKFFPTVADVIARIPDGRPGVEEAWAMLPKDEYSSTVWTDEMSLAFDVCRQLLDTDPIAARMAFKETYAKLCAEAKEKGKPANWTVSYGMEISGREAAVREAAEKNRISLSYAKAACPELEFEPEEPKEIAQPERVVKLLESALKEIPK